MVYCYQRQLSQGGGRLSWFGSLWRLRRATSSPNGWNHPQPLGGSNISSRGAHFCWDIFPLLIINAVDLNICSTLSHSPDVRSLFINISISKTWFRILRLLNCCIIKFDNEQNHCLFFLFEYRFQLDWVPPARSVCYFNLPCRRVWRSAIHSFLLPIPFCGSQSPSWHSPPGALLAGLTQWRQGSHLN